jgi:hypothetical protein
MKGKEVCYNCKQHDHMKGECPKLMNQGSDSEGKKAHISINLIAGMCFID